MSRWGIIDRTMEGRQRLYFPHFMDGKVPLDPEANARWRTNTFPLSNPEARKALVKMCREDFLFWLTGFASIYDAGDESGKAGRVSFIPYEFQIEMFTALWSAVYDKRCQIRIKKNRRDGVSWGVCALISHGWSFLGERHYLIGSHREQEVDGSGSVAKASIHAGQWSCLMPKMDYIDIYQPKWLLPNGYVPRTAPWRSRMKKVNPESGALIEGTSASSKSGHGPRGWLAFWDEAAETTNLYDIIAGLSAYSPCKIWVSTIGDLSHPFSTILRESPEILQVSLRWDMNPEYTDGLTVDPETGKTTSPWLERKLADINHEPTIANRMYFADESFQAGNFYEGCFQRMSETVLPPTRTGELIVHEAKDGLQAVGFADQDNGRWKLWMDLDESGMPLKDTLYVLGADISAGGIDEKGRGMSNSVLVAIDARTHSVVAQFVTHGMFPFEFAGIVAAAGRWLRGRDHREAYLSFENNGPGNEFAQVIRRKHEYENVYRSAAAKPNSAFGWFKGVGEDTLNWFALHRQMICEGTFTERDEDCIEEMRHYQYSPTGKAPPVYLPSIRTEDPSGARDNHGDRVIARIAALVALRARPYEETVKRIVPPAGSWEWFERMEERDNYLKALV